MSPIKVTLTAKVPSYKNDTAFVIGVREGANYVKSQSLVLGKSRVDTSSLRKHDLAQLGASATAEALTKVAAPNGAVFALLGLGSEKFDEHRARNIGGAIARNLRGFSEVVIDLGTLTKDQILGLIEGLHLGLYEFTGKRNKSSIKEPKLSRVIILSDLKISATDLSRAQIIGDAVNNTRDLVNAPPNEMYPAIMVRAAQKAAVGLNVKVQVWDEKALAKDRFGGILAVGMGSSRPPRLVKLEYKPKQANTKQVVAKVKIKHLSLVGKGITFDTGGLSLKPSESMVGMKYDMTGAATCFQAIIAIAKLGLPVHVTAWLCLAENMPSGTAQRPDDVITIRNGKTVEVLNTDAEGRLVLADGLSAAAETKPDLIIDLATLTGAATVALGNRYAGLMGDAKAIEAIESAAEQTGELVWHMPLPAELRSLLNSDVADIANVKIGNRAGGMLIGGHFLREFVPKEIPWAHLDIAGPADNSGTPYGYTPKGGTGTLVRTLIATAQALSINK